MGKNKIENFIFTAIMCFFMVLGMSFYNSILKNGFTSIVFLNVSKSFLIVYFIALFIDWFFVGPLAKGLAKNLTNEDTPFIKKIMLISLFMVIGMSFCMSFLATIVEHGLSSQFLITFIKTELRNFIVALPLQILVVGPTTRALFLKLFPIKSVKA